MMMMMHHASCTPLSSHAASHKACRALPFVPSPLLMHFDDSNLLQASSQCVAAAAAASGHDAGLLVCCGHVLDQVHHAAGCRRAEEHK
jgi:hypothetical protein